MTQDNRNQQNQGGHHSDHARPSDRQQGDGRRDHQDGNRRTGSNDTSRGGHTDGRR